MAWTALSSYEYELRDNDNVVATGRLTVDQPLAVGDQVAIGKRTCLVIDLMPGLAGRERRVILGAESSS